jgi:hypothetical protein
MGIKNPEARRAYWRAYRARNAAKVKAYNREYRAAHKDEANARNRKYKTKRTRDPQKSAEYKRKWRASHQEQVKAYAKKRWSKLRLTTGPATNRLGRLKRYGLTVEAYRQLVDAQAGLCAICRRQPTGRGQAGILHVDHDHVTGKIRALLCTRCNTALGLLLDDPTIVQEAVEYLKRFALRQEEAA